MKIFFACATKEQRKIVLESSAKSYLLSYAYWRADNMISVPGVTLMVDSGAFTAWTKGKKIKLFDYLDFCLKIRNRITSPVWFVNLDVIPGKFAEQPSFENTEKAALQGYKNYMQMRRYIPNTIHVFHQYESLYHLERLIDSGCTYIGISPANDVSTQSKCQWLDKVFSFLGKRTRLLKTHCFGATAPSLLNKYPFYSADSTAWFTSEKFNQIYAFKYGKLHNKQLRSIQKHISRYDVVTLSKSRKYRLENGVRAGLLVESYISNLWEKRGAIWDE